MGINSWNQDLARQKNVQLSLLPEGTDDPLADLKDKLTDAETEMRGLFRRVVEVRNPDTCGLCTHKMNYEIALLVGLDNVTREQLEKHQRIWKDVEVLKQSIITKDALMQTKARSILAKELLKQVKAADKKLVESLNRAIEAEKQSVAELRPLHGSGTDLSK